MERRVIPSFTFCLLMDLLGCASYAVPVLGEVSDIIWAPISAFIFYRTFKGPLGTFGGIFNFIEELFPGLDFIPSFTIAWVVVSIREHTHAGSRKAFNDLQAGKRA